MTGLVGEGECKAGETKAAVPSQTAKQTNAPLVTDNECLRVQRV
jgi:hypothetical protein